MTPAESQRVCSVEDCGRPCASPTDPLCHGHRSRKRRGQPLGAPWIRVVPPKPAPDAVVCCVPGCGRVCKPYRALCEGHRRRKDRGVDLEHPPLRQRGARGLARRLEDAAHAYFAAETDEDFERARARFRMILRDAGRLALAKDGATASETDGHGQHSSAKSCPEGEA